ncbi:pyridoxamine 5'-phosphate oxidase [Cytophaga sp. FL35]|uniref:pyridoxamine 5'-phosphate oxidase n=1 Tax=Cytophaga sp. FL35 TaxID=1904456 RepID=UPI0016537577|nr:pyridoxamine 5'-phosphate oxidase [Cytophaga sp. FL35]MBC7000067.1 pyridoxamine 5'-phosphate oxidase [Cytophaga sp. FL35]
MQKDLGDYRKSYEKSELTEDVLPTLPIELFQRWFMETEAQGQVEEPNAMTLSTLGLDGYPKSRVVLLKEFNSDGFVFYTNYESEKGKSIAVNNKVCLSFFWPAMERQVIIKGQVKKVDGITSDAYFNSRPEGSKLGAWASNQSTVIPSRQFLENRLEELETEFKGTEIKRPAHWGGYLVIPEEMEFWQGRANRLHDRILYSAEENGVWNIERLSP